ncbi:MAG: hypothetical protein RBS57_21745, partial [Desulforhabdus sp.]|nr:hypothetical protein [Desulforhabdus sp.]
AKQNIILRLLLPVQSFVCLVYPVIDIGKLSLCLPDRIFVLIDPPFHDAPETTTKGHGSFSQM